MAHSVVLRGQAPGQVDVEAVTDDPTADFDPAGQLRALVTDVVLPKGATLSVDGQQMDADGLQDVLMSTMSGVVVVDAEDVCESVLSKGLANYPAGWNMPTRRLPVRQAASRCGLVKPDPRTAVYLASTDVIPAAVQAMRTMTRHNADLLAASIGLTYDPQALGILVRDEAELKSLEAAVAAYAATLPALSPDAQRLLSQFSSLTFASDLVIPLRLRADSSNAADPLSFARVVVEGCRRWSASKGGRVLAFDLAELVCPTALCLVSADAHAHADSQQVDEAWGDIVRGLARPVTVVSQSQLSRVDAAQRQLRNTQRQMASTASSQVTSKGTHRAFSKTCPTTVDLSRFVGEIAKRMGDVMRSQNAYKDRHHSFSRQSRRRPDDCDAPGTSISTKYHPDIHLYVDTSGSISEENYEDEVKAIIQLARRLDVNLWFTSFSHYMTKPALLHLKGRSLRQAYAEVERLDKADGGTDFSQIWSYVQISARRRRELSLVITDFGYVAPNVPATHPKNLFYAPCSVEPTEWGYVCANAKEFVDSMRYVDPNVRGRMLM